MHIQGMNPMMGLGLNTTQTGKDVVWTPSAITHTGWIRDFFRSPMQIADWCVADGGDGGGLPAGHIGDDASGCAIDHLAAVRAGRVALLIGLSVGALGMYLYKRKH